MGVRRAIGVVRVSERKGREGKSFASPEDQRDRMIAACERDQMQLVLTRDEIDVSGGKPLEQRPGLKAAVEAVEAGQADVVMVAYFDRLVRSLRVQDEVVSRVEKAGGRVLALDFGEITGDSAAQWLSGTMLGAFNEYYRRSIRERSGDSQARAVARGVAPWPNLPAGYLRGEDGRLQPDPASVPIIREAFKMRAAGATVREIRTFLAANGIVRSYHSVHRMLSSRVYLGEIHFGGLANTAAHPAIVDTALWRQVQRIVVSRGRRAKSERLLARLGVLRCGSCDYALVVSHANGYPVYRCGRVPGDCTHRVAISATLAERVVADRVRAALADAEGRASVAQNARDAERTLECAQADFDAAIRAFAGFDGEPAARKRLLELQAARDECQARLDHLGGGSVGMVVSVAADWDRLTVDERRALIRATVARARVDPGRGAERVTVEFFGQQPARSSV